MECQIAKTPEFPTLVCYKMQEPKLQKTKERWVQENKKTAREYLEYVVVVMSVSLRTISGLSLSS